VSELDGLTNDDGDEAVCERSSGGAADHQDLGAVDPLQGLERALSLGWIAHRSGSQTSKVLAGRQPRRAAAHPDRGLVMAGGFLGEQHPQTSAGFQRPAVALAITSGAGLRPDGSRSGAAGGRARPRAAARRAA